MEPLFITSRTDWTPALIERVWKEIEIIAEEEMELKPGVDIYPNSIEIISAEQMLDAYSSIGLPIHYNHWSFGKDFLKSHRAYQTGRQGLAYEIVINTNPCISYLMEDNNMLMQTMVMAHAAIGHNAVFKNNECFKQWTNAGSIVDYMIFARDYIRQCEERYGEEEVEMVLDAAHALAPHGVDKFKRKHQPRMNEEARLIKLLKDEDQKQKELDIIMKKTSIKDVDLDEHDAEDSPEEEENLLYFIMKHSPSLPQWKREIIRIVYKVNQYFYPQGQCVTGENLVATGNGLFRLDELVQADGYKSVDGVKLLTQGDRFTDISHTYKKLAKVVKVKTISGREIIGTPEHPLMTLQGVSHGLTTLGSMVLGDHLVLNTNYNNMFATELVKLKQLNLTETLSCSVCNFESENLATHMVQTHGMAKGVFAGNVNSMANRASKSKNLPIKYPSELTSKVAEFIACLQSMTLSKTNVFPAARPQFFNGLATSLFGLELNDDAFSSWGLKCFIEQFDLIGVPKCIRTSPKDVIVSYLRMLFDIGATRRSSVSVFEFNGQDEQLSHLQVLLNALGIIAGVRTTDQDTIAENKVLQINSSYRNAFENIIGSNYTLPTYKGNPRVASTDLIPGAMALLKQVKTYVESNKANVVNETSGIFYAQKLAQKLRLKDHDDVCVLALPQIRGDEISKVDVMREPARFEVACNVNCEAARQLKLLLDNSIGCFYDRIVSIEELEEEREVFDVTVPENHLFWMSGLISHNTKNLNEGFASFTHYYIMTRLEEKGFLSPDAFMSFLESHSGVIYQPVYTDRWYGGANPYALGFAIFQDLKRMCDNPTDEDREWFPHIMGRKWQDVVKEAAFEYRDDGFIAQNLSPKVIRDLKLFTISFDNGDPAEQDEDDDTTAALVSEIHDDVGYKNVRNALARSMERINYVPQIIVKEADLEGDRTLKLEYVPYMGRTLDLEDADLVTDYIDSLWGYAVEIDC